MKVFRINGEFQMGHERQRFSKEYAAKDEHAARDLCFSRFGSKHGVPRRLVWIEKVQEIPVKDVVDPVVRAQIQAGS